MQGDKNALLSLWWQLYKTQARRDRAIKSLAVQTLAPASPYGVGWVGWGREGGDGAESEPVGTKTQPSFKALIDVIHVPKS